MKDVNLKEIYKMCIKGNLIDPEYIEEEEELEEDVEKEEE